MGYVAFVACVDFVLLTNVGVSHSHNVAGSSGAGHTVAARETEERVHVLDGHNQLVSLQHLKLFREPQSTIEGKVTVHRHKPTQRKHPISPISSQIGFQLDSIIYCAWQQVTSPSI